MDDDRTVVFRLLPFVGFLSVQFMQRARDVIAVLSGYGDCLVMVTEVQFQPTVIPPHKTNLREVDNIGLMAAQYR